MLTNWGYKRREAKGDEMSKDSKLKIDGQYVYYVNGHNVVTLDGYFTLEDLYKVIGHMKEHMKPEDLGA